MFHKIVQNENLKLNISKTKQVRLKTNVRTRSWSIKQGITVLKFQKILKFIFSNKKCF